MCCWRYFALAAGVFGSQLLVSGSMDLDDFFGALMLTTAVLALLGKLHQMRLNFRHRSLCGMDLTKEEARILCLGAFYVFALSGPEAMPLSVLLPRAAPLLVPVVFITQGFLFGDPDARPVLRRSLIGVS